MRNSVAALLTLLIMSVSTSAAHGSDQTFDWGQWRYLPVQDDGRLKPLDTLARETARMIGKRTSFTDPETSQELDCVALYLAMLFDWQGWDKPPGPHAMAKMHPGMAYYDNHQADKWDKAPLIRINSRKLREALGIGKNQEYVSPLQLGKADIRDPRTGKKTPFSAWTQKLVCSEQTTLSALEKEALQLANKLWSYQDHRMGRRLEVLPAKDSPGEQWISVAHLLRTDFDEETDPTGALRKTKEHFQKARAAYLADSPETFNRAATAFIHAAREVGAKTGPYPGRGAVNLEVTYNRWLPFRLAWVFSLVALVCLLLSTWSRWKVFFITGLSAFGAGLVAMIIGFGMRTLISGRAPVTNLYESVVFMGLGAALFGLVFGLFLRRQYVFIAAAAVATVALILADNCPSVLDPRLRPLQPVLRSNFWLAVHVMTIMLSYAAFALALAVGNITLGYYLFRSKRKEAINAQCRFTYRTLQAGVLLLLLGTILGALWADYSWGRFWGWDPKEVWALITLLCYLAVLHARYVGWVGNRALAALSVICFSMVIMAWYGVNMLGTGLHNYGFASGGQYYVLGTITVQFLYVAAAIFKSANAKVRWELP